MREWECCYFDWDCFKIFNKHHQFTIVFLLQLYLYFTMNINWFLKYDTDFVEVKSPPVCVCVCVSGRGVRQKVKRYEENIRDWKKVHLIPSILLTEILKCQYAHFKQYFDNTLTILWVYWKYWVKPHSTQRSKVLNLSLGHI